MAVKKLELDLTQCILLGPDWVRAKMVEAGIKPTAYTWNGRGDKLVIREKLM